MTLFDDILNNSPLMFKRQCARSGKRWAPMKRLASYRYWLVSRQYRNLVKLLVKLSTAQIRQAFGNKHRVVIVGPTNVGKSTLYNQLVQTKRPGRCRSLARYHNRKSTGRCSPV